MFDRRTNWTPIERFRSTGFDWFLVRFRSISYAGTHPGSASVQRGLRGRTENSFPQALTFFTQTTVSCCTSTASTNVQSFWAAVNAVKLLNLHILQLFVNYINKQLYDDINCEYGDISWTIPVEEAKDALSHVQRGRIFTTS